MKPLLKWAGGKRQLVDVISKALPSDWASRRFFEPFLGGAAVFFGLRPKEAVLSDVNHRLVGFYKSISREVEAVILEIQSISRKFDSTPDAEKKNYYLQLRESYNSQNLSSAQDAALLYALNKLCFNGLYRENSKGEFNVPFGNKSVFPPMPKEDFRLASEILKNTKLVVADFQKSLKSARAGDVVYLDPPYIPLHETSSFTTYAAGGFGLQEQERLSQEMKRLKTLGVDVLLSNSDTPMTREIFAGNRFLEISAARSVSAKSSGRGKVQELLIANY